jgi:hypothetical protein
MTDYSVDIPKGRLHRRAGPWNTPSTSRPSS